MVEQTNKPTGEQVLQEVASVAFAPAGDGTGAALKYSNKLKALEMLCKLMGLSGDRAPGEPGGEGSTGVVLMPEIEKTE